MLLDAMPGPTTPERLHRAAADLLSRFPRWARTYQGDDGAQRLVTDALAVLRSFGLLRTRSSGLVEPLPTAARYRLATIRTTSNE
ncbi:DUF2398 family protein, partial [Nocardia farcinica]|uniref:DUF2398 family protein n=1 Tax=Nocardia farcinica TaxID=37329 RepID=UPI0034DB217C